MEIIKQFSDSILLCKLQKNNSLVSFFYWGLGRDGQLYYKTDYWQNPPYYWYAFECNSYNMPIGINEMKKIIKEFGHLLVWI